MAQASLEGSSLSLPLDRSWTPSTPIVFADKPRSIRDDFTWKRGNQIIFGPTSATVSSNGHSNLQTQKRTYATKPPIRQPPPLPARYQPRAPRTRGDVANPNDLSFLGLTSKPTPPRPVLPKPIQSPSTPSTIAPAQQLSNSIQSTSTPSTVLAAQHLSVEAEASIAIKEEIATKRSEHDNPSLNLQNPAAAPTPISSLEDQVKSAIALSETAVASARKDTSPSALGEPSLVDNFENVNLMLREALLAIERTHAQQNSDLILQHRREKLAMSRLHAQEKQQLTERMNTASAAKADEAKRLRSQIEALKTREAALETAVNALKQNTKLFDTTKRALQANNDHLQQELDKERAPEMAQFKRLTKYNETRLDQEERDRQQRQKDSRLAQRATYTHFQDFFIQGGREVRRWTIADTGSYAKLERRSAAYWANAAHRFDSFAHDIAEKDDFRAWDINVAARDQGLSTKDTANRLKKFDRQLKNRDILFKALASHLKGQAQESAQASQDYENLLWEFEHVTWDNLKIQSHDARHYVRALRLSEDTPPPLMANRYFADAQSAKTDGPLRDVSRALVTELQLLRRATSQEDNPERLVYLHKRRDAAHAQIHLVTIAREIALRHDDLVEADWMKQQPLSQTASRDEIQPLISASQELRFQIENAVQDFSALGLDTKHWFLKFHEHYSVRGLITELEKIIYRNNVLLERHNKFEDVEMAKLKALPLRRYQESVGYLRVLLHGSEDFKIHTWFKQVVGRRKARQRGDVEILDGPNPLNILPSPTPRRVGMTKNERLARTRKPYAESSTSNAESSKSNKVASHKVATNTASKSTIPAEHMTAAEQVTAAKQAAVLSTKATDASTGVDDFSDSPMDAFEISKPEEPEVPTFEKPLGNGSIEMITANSVPNPQLLDVSSSLELVSAGASEDAGAVPSIPKPSYKSLKLPSSNVWRGVSATIQPQRGVLPKPDFQGRRRTRLSFKPTKPRKHAFHIDSTNGPSEEVASTTEGETSRQADSKEIHVPFKFQIPPNDFRNALIASENSGASFWKHTLYKGPASENIRIHYCTKFDQAEREAKSFLEESVVGFDIEWEPGTSLETGLIKDNVSLIQIACESRIALFQIAAFYGDTIEKLMPPSLRAILESPNIVKAGVNVAADFTRLRKCFGIEGHGLFELSHLYKVVQFSETEPTKVDKKLCSLAKQVHQILFLPLGKGAVRTSAWSKKLSMEQTEYAASDAYAGLRLYDALEAKRKSMDPTPPRPAFHELQQPLILGNGEPPPRIRKAKKDVAKNDATFEDTIVTEESTTAVETEDGKIDEMVVDEDEAQVLEEIVNEVEEGVEQVSESDDDDFYSCKSDDGEGDVYQLRQGQRSAEPASPTSNSSSALRNPGTAPLAPIELIKAEKWLAEWRENTKVDNKFRNIPSWLRAYALWHPQSLELGEVAALLRDPPLAHTSVAQYVLEAIRNENLPFDSGRLREALKTMPASVQWRYSRVIEKMRRMERG